MNLCLNVLQPILKLCFSMFMIFKLFCACNETIFLIFMILLLFLPIFKLFLSLSKVLNLNPKSDSKHFDILVTCRRLVSLEVTSITRPWHPYFHYFQLSKTQINIIFNSIFPSLSFSNIYKNLKKTLAHHEDCRGIQITSATLGIL